VLVNNESDEESGAFDPARAAYCTERADSPKSVAASVTVADVDDVSPLPRFCVAPGRLWLYPPLAPRQVDRW
jgi:hypothetical protein